MQALARASDSLLAFAGRSHGRAAALLLLFGLMIFTPGLLAMQPMDRDEPRFAQAAKQMLESGDLVDIRFQDEARHKKPVGVYWLQAAAVAAGEGLGVDDARRQIWLYRLPSFAGALAAILLVYWAALALVAPPAAFAAALAFGASILIGGEARLAKTDAAMCATAVVVFAIYARLWVLRRTAVLRPWEVFAFWAAIGVSALLKGPVIGGLFMLAAATLSIRERSLAWLRPLADWRGVLLALLIVLPWFVAIAAKSGGAFFIEAVRDDMLGKVASGQEAHGAPPGVYLLILPVIFWPTAALAYLAAPYAWRSRRDDAVAACLAWLVPAWMMFELIPTKLPHYVLPLLPALAILLVKAAAEDGAPGRGRAWRAWALLLLPLPALVLAGLAPAAVALLEPGGPARFAPLFWAAPWLALTLAAALAAVLMARAGRALQAIPVAAAASLLLSVAVYQVAWPALRSIQLSPRLAAAAGASGCADPRMATVGGYNEPSLVFLTRTDLVMTMAAGGAAFMAGEGCRIAFVTAQEDAAFRAEAGKLGVPLRLLTRVEGVNINRAVDRARGTVRVMDIGVYLRDTSRP